MTLRVFDTGVASAAENMGCDDRLLDTLENTPILHLYEWDSPSATYGYFINPGKYFDVEKAALRGVQLARRPTGGGIVFHIWDFAFSFLMPSSHQKFSLNTLENYQFVNSAVLDAVSEVFALKESVLIEENFPSFTPDCHNFCMAKPTQYDVVYKGRKVAGAAQRKRKRGYLHQGTISLASPDLTLLREILRSEKAVLDAMNRYTFSPLGSDVSSLKRAKEEMRKHLIEQLLINLHIS